MSIELEMKDRFPQLDTSNWLLPSTLEELSKAVQENDYLYVGGGNNYRLVPRGRGSSSWKDEEGNHNLVQDPQPLLVRAPAKKLLLDNINQMLWFSPENQLVSVQSGILLSELNKSLREQGFEIPIGLRDDCQKECIGDLIAMNLPHWNMAQAGSWRDWIVKMKIVLANGEPVSTGADVVKNVTGFDLHKLIIGARHTLGIVEEVTLRVRPKSESREWPPIQLNHGELLHTTPSGIRAMREFLKHNLEPEGDDYQMVHYICEENSLALVESLSNHRFFGDPDASRFKHEPDGHVWRSHVGEYALDEFSDLEQRLMKRTKEIFDPTYKLNPGEFGFI